MTYARPPKIGIAKNILIRFLCYLGLNVVNNSPSFSKTAVFIPLHSQPSYTSITFQLKELLVITHSYPVKQWISTGRIFRVN